MKASNSAPSARRRAARHLLALVLGMLLSAPLRAATISYGADEFPGFTAIQRGAGLSLHKDNYILPVTYATDWYGDQTEAVFQLSVKQRMFINNLYFAYTQKSFWQAYNHDISAPFRETNYNPEAFYRWLPGDEFLARWHLDRWGFDAGIEHESNGRTWPGSRSWNRAYFTPFRPSADGNSLWHMKFWYRFPENAKNGPTDPGGDDNPDIYRYYGWSEVSYRHQFASHWLLNANLRGNTATGYGTLALRLSTPADNRQFFYVIDLFSGYGESLIDYNRETHRIGVGIMFNR